jgi:hypothetical protein
MQKKHNILHQKRMNKKEIKLKKDTNFTNLHRLICANL